MSNAYQNAVFPGDGHGPDDMEAATRVLRASATRYGFTLEFTHFPHSGTHFLKTGELLPDLVCERLSFFDGILFGGVHHEKAEPQTSV